MLKITLFLLITTASVYGSELFSGFPNLNAPVIQLPPLRTTSSDDVLDSLNLTNYQLFIHIQTILEALHCHPRVFPTHVFFQTRQGLFLEIENGFAHFLHTPWGYITLGCNSQSDTNALLARLKLTPVTHVDPQFDPFLRIDAIDQILIPAATHREPHERAGHNDVVETYKALKARYDQEKSKKVIN